MARRPVQYIDPITAATMQSSEANAAQHRDTLRRAADLMGSDDDWSPYLSAAAQAPFSTEQGMNLMRTDMAQRQAQLARANARQDQEQAWQQRQRDLHARNAEADLAWEQEKRERERKQWGQQEETPEGLINKMLMDELKGLGGAGAQPDPLAPQNRGPFGAQGAVAPKKDPLGIGGFGADSEMGQMAQANANPIAKFKELDAAESGEEFRRPAEPQGPMTMFDKLQAASQRNPMLAGRLAKLGYTMPKQKSEIEMQEESLRKAEITKRMSDLQKPQRSEFARQLEELDGLVKEGRISPEGANRIKAQLTGEKPSALEEKLAEIERLPITLEEKIRMRNQALGNDPAAERGKQVEAINKVMDRPGFTPDRAVNFVQALDSFGKGQGDLRNVASLMQPAGPQASVKAASGLGFTNPKEMMKAVLPDFFASYNAKQPWYNKQITAFGQNATMAKQFEKEILEFMQKKYGLDPAQAAEMIVQGL